MQTQELIDFLKAKEPNFTSVIADGDGRHFTVKITSSLFNGLSTLKRQQLVLSHVSELIKSGKLHAINIIAVSDND